LFPAARRIVSVKPDMTTEMQRVLLELSVFFDADPSVIFRHVLETISAFYGGTMTMINVRVGEKMIFKETVNTHPCLAGISSIVLSETF